MIRDDGDYRGINFVRQVMMNAKPEDIRKYFKAHSLFRTLKNFCDDSRGTWKWESNVVKVNITEIVRSDIVDLLEKGIEMEINGHRGKIGTREGIHYFVGMDWFKAAYIQCYNEDNGIKEDCFITTAVCNNFGKFHQIFEEESL